MRWLALLAACCLCACIERARLNTNCDWGAEDSRPLDLADAADQWHLTIDAQLAEELAIRHGDARRRTQPLDEVRRLRAQCLTALVEGVAMRHGVTPDQVRQAALRRDLRVDVGAVLLPVAIVFGLAASIVTGFVSQRFPADEPRAALGATVIAAVMLSAAGVMLLEMWGSLVEMIRVSDTHISFRGGRGFWVNQRITAFAGGVALFAIVACAGRFAARRS